MRVIKEREREGTWRRETEMGEDVKEQRKRGEWSRERGGGAWRKGGCVSRLYPNPTFLTAPCAPFCGLQYLNSLGHG